MNSHRSLIKHQINHSILFKSLDDEARDAVAQIAQAQPFEAQEVLLEEGQTNNNLYLLSTGKVHIWTSSESIIVELKDLGPGDFFGEVGFLREQPATATVEALQPGIVIVFPKNEMNAVLKDHPTVARILNQLTIHRAKDTITKLMS